MTRAGLLALCAGGCGVLGAWEALAAAERARLGRRAMALVAPLRDAGRDGGELAAPERRRLARLGALLALAGGWLVGGWFAALVAGAAGPATVSWELARRRRAHREAVAAGAATAARVLADAVAAGHPVRGAIGAAASGVPGPAGAEMRRCAAAVEVGDPTETALERLRARAGSPAWDTLTAALLLQRDAGGDLAGLLRRIAGTLEAATRAEADARTATAQARFTAMLVAALPAAAALLTELAAPGFAGRLLADPLSRWLVAAAAMLQVTGFLAVRLIAR